MIQSIGHNDPNACDIPHRLIGTSLSAALMQQCGPFTISTSKYSGSESDSCTAHITGSGGSCGWGRRDGISVCGRRSVRREWLLRIRSDDRIAGDRWLWGHPNLWVLDQIEL
jgi:hypothetical protein